MRWLIAFGIGAVLLVAGCSKDSSSSGPDQKLADTEYLALGWSDLDAQRYDSAVNNFTNAYNQGTSPTVRGDALNGRGWSYAYKRELPKSSGDFVFAASYNGITPAALNDVRAGAAFVLYSLNDFPSAITYSNAVLTDNPSYAFSHDAKVTAKRLRLLLVQSYYANGQFSAAASQMDIVDPLRSPHSPEPSVVLASITAALNSL
jgi:hypothetical protein